MVEELDLAHLQRGCRLMGSIAGDWGVEDQPMKQVWTKLIQEIAWLSQTEQGYPQPRKMWQTVVW
jgi:hypothetical protein